MTTFGRFLPKSRLLVAAATLCTLTAFVPAPLAQAQDRQALPTRLAAPASAQPVGHLPSSQVLRLALTLPLRNQEELQRLLRQLYNPGSPNYRKFLSVQQFTEQFGPTAADYQKLTSYAESHGLTVTNTAPNRLVLDVRGPVSAIEQAFQLKMQLYRHPTENRTYYAPSVEPSVEPGIPLQGISGLNNFAPPRPVGLKRSPEGERVHSNQTGSGPGGQFLGSDMRAAYYGGTALTGTGQSIGLFEFGPYNLSDVQNYFSLVGQPLNVPIVNVLLDGVSPVCGAGCDDGEEVIDIEQAISMAPGLSSIIVYEGNDDVDMFNQMATDNIAKQLSCSFGFLPADPASDEPIFMEFAAQGQNLFVASGDSGAFDANNPVFYPADDPFITDVGGTDLTTVSAGGAWQSEVAWSGSSGGITTDGFAIPSYQVPVINSSNQGSTTLRNLPDVAAEANTDNIFCANGGCFEGVGGTSLAAPRWAGFMALANEQAGGTPIGFLNPTIYSIGQSANYDSDFHDITSGNNDNGDGTSFNAVIGYDLVTGWGSPNGQDLLNALGPAPSGSAQNFALSPSPATLNLTQGGSGTATIAVSAINGFNGAVNLRVTVLGSPAGVTASVNPVSITGSGGATLTVSTTTATPGGNFQIVVSGTSGSLTQTAYITLALPGFSLVAANSGNEFLNQSGINTSQIKISAVNGFHGKVSFAVSGVPKGVIATLTPTSSRQSAWLRLSAYPWAPTGFSTLTVTGTSGNLSANRHHQPGGKRSEECKWRRSRNGSVFCVQRRRHLHRWNNLFHRRTRWRWLFLLGKPAGPRSNAKRNPLQVRPEESARCRERHGAADSPAGRCAFLLAADAGHRSRRRPDQSAGHRHLYRRQQREFDAKFQRLVQPRQIRRRDRSGSYALPRRKRWQSGQPHLQSVSLLNSSGQHQNRAKHNPAQQSQRASARSDINKSLGDCWSTRKNSARILGGRILCGAALR